MKYLAFNFLLLSILLLFSTCTPEHEKIKVQYLDNRLAAYHATNLDTMLDLIIETRELVHKLSPEEIEELNETMHLKPSDVLTFFDDAIHAKKEVFESALLNNKHYQDYLQNKIINQMILFEINEIKKGTNFIEIEKRLLKEFGAKNLEIFNKRKDRMDSLKLESMRIIKQRA